jgi:hypothetical protein
MDQIYALKMEPIAQYVSPQTIFFWYRHPVVVQTASTFTAGENTLTYASLLKLPDGGQKRSKHVVTEDN